jgi:pyridoxal phosphate enzyme (YggS family)
MLIGNIIEVLKRISHACMRSGRGPADAQLVAVSKTVDIPRIQDAIDAGLRTFGENRVQEAARKIEHFRERSGITWHFIGTLQKNKAKKAVALFDVIESVDSMELLEKIEKYASDAGKVQKIFIQVKLSSEVSKFGAAPEYGYELVRRATELQHVDLEGLMTIPPYFEDAEESRPYFRRLREIQGDLIEKGFEIRNLSMGMSNDYEVAIEEGATIVRIGTAIFGERVYQ